MWPLLGGERGLRTIYKRLIYDVITVGVFYSCISCPNDADVVVKYFIVLAAVALWTIFEVGFTNRWTITFPMFPLLVLQSIRLLIVVVINQQREEEQENKWILWTIAILSHFLAFISAILSLLLLPPVQLPSIQGKYNVGVANLFLPIPSDNDKKKQEWINAKLIYPTAEKSSFSPFIQKDTANQFLYQSFRFAAPGPMKSMAWFFLHSWNLVRLEATLNAKPMPKPSTDKNDSSLGWPIIAYSHGLAGSADIYSYQTMSLVAQEGCVIISVNHTDGSHPVVQKHDKQLLFYDETLERELKNVEYVKARRKQAQHRARELVGAMKALQKLNTIDYSPSSLSFRGLLDTNRSIFMGHSFGGATALTAALRHPDLCRAGVLAHDPGTDWMPDDVRYALFPPQLVKQSSIQNYVGGTGGWPDPPPSPPLPSPIKGMSLVEAIPIMALYSQQWYDLQWSGVRVFEWMMQNGKLGNGTYKTIREAAHQEFSDICMLTPLWLARPAKATGKRHPHDTADEIATLTADFFRKITSSH